MPAASAPGRARWWLWLPLLAAWAASRALLVAEGLRELPFYPAGPDAFSDLTVYAQWVPLLQAGDLPVDDRWQYPPLSAFFFLAGGVGADAVTALLVAIVLVDLVLTCVLAAHTMRAGALWVLFGLVIGPVLVSRFDVVPTLFAVLAVLAAGRPVAVGIWAGLGAGAKLWPVLLLATVPRRSIVSAGAALGVTVLAGLAVAAAFFDGLSGFLAGQGNRGLQAESVGALPFLIRNAAVGGVGIDYRYGSMEITDAGAGVVATILTVVAGAGFGWLAVVWWRRRLETRLPADVAFTVVLFSVVVSRVFSPQYSVWLLGLGTLCLVAPGSRVRGPVVLVAVAAVITQVLYPSGYGWLLAGDPTLVSLQALRIGLVVAAAAWAWYRVVLGPWSHCAARSP